MKRLGIVCLGVLAALAAPAVARADEVINWSLRTQETILEPGVTAHATTPVFAMVNGAVYDAVNSIDQRHQRYLPVPPTSRSASQDAAAATASFMMLTALYPAQLARLQPFYAASLAAIGDGRAKTRGIAAGEAAAAAMLRARENDGRLTTTTPYPFEQGTTPGAWRVSWPQTAVDPAWWVGNVRPFMIPDARWFRSDGPNDLRSRAYARDFNEVKEIGALASTTRTADQTTAAVFWQAQPVLLWSTLMRELSARYGLSTAQNARLFGMVALAMADSGITCWNDKYHVKFWRPIDAVRLADTDGNPATQGDPAWRPLFDAETAVGLATPNFPEHPSGHSCVTGTVMSVLRDYFGTDRVAFDVISPRFPDQPRHFERFSQALEEVIDARVWGGIHFRTADEQGAEIGESVARWERRHFFGRRWGF
jgi:hypothetical protein